MGLGAYAIMGQDSEGPWWGVNTFWPRGEREPSATLWQTYSEEVPRAYAFV